MRRRAAFAALLAATLLLCASALAAPAPDRRIAITIDDLPWQSLPGKAPVDLAARHARLMHQLRQANVPVVGFVNEGKLDVDGVPQPERVSMLRDWLDGGHELGNHTFGHVDLHAVGREAFQADVLRGERVLRPMLAERGQVPRWFRHPYLRAGQDPATRDALKAFLGEHGYRIAPVTVDNSEWVWAFAYRRVMDGEVATPDREATLERLRRGYVPYMLNKLDYFEGQSQALLGRALAQVWLLHANELNADAFAALVAGAQRRGYRIVSLDEVLRDPAYARGEGAYNGRYGPSWLHRWAMADARPASFYAGEPATPRWVMDLADVDSE